MTSETQLGDLLMQWEELRHQGKSVAVEELCADTPELQEELRRRIEALKALEQVLTVTPAPGSSTVSYEGSAPSAPMELPAIPGYEVLSELGHGGMGVVYKVRNVGMDRVEALKMMRAPSAHLAQRFQVEIRAAAKGDNNNIVQIYFDGQHDGQRYFTMQYVEGGTLAEHSDQFQGKPEAAVRLLAKVARAVHYLHEKGIIHRDLKPSNILLKEKDEPLVSDFGLARFFDQEIEAPSPEQPGADPQLTRTGAVIGTTYYMSPEQAAGSGKYTAATDVWALGVILYELLTGRRPFSGKDDKAVRNAILNAKPASPRDFQKKIDRDLEAICLKCLEKEPVSRYKTAEALANDLERWLCGDAILPEGLLRRAWRHVRRRPTLSGTMVLGIVAAALLVAAMYYGDPDRVLKSEINPRLERDERVVLIPTEGSPHWFRWRLPGTIVPAKGESPFSLHSGSLSLLELLPSPIMKRFRFRAEVRHEHSLVGDVGLYTCHSEHALPKGQLHCFVRLSFADWGEEARRPNGEPQGKLRATLLHCWQPNVGIGPAELPLGFRKEFMPFGPAGPSDWRKLAVDVDMDDIRFRWGEENELVGTLPGQMRVHFAKSLASRKPDLENVQPEFPPQGGLGLYVQRGAASFRNVVIESLVP